MENAYESSESIDAISDSMLLISGATACFEVASTSGVGVDGEALSAAVTMVENAAVGAEHCRVHTSRLSSGVDDPGKWRAATQVLILRGAVLRGMCTVDSVGHNDVDVNRIQVNHAVLTHRVWLEALDGAAVVSPIGGVTVRDHHSAGSPPPIVVSSSDSLGALDTNDDLARECLSLPGLVRVAYTSPHPWENRGPSPFIGKAWTQFEAVEARKASLDAYWAVGMQGNDARPAAATPA